MSITSANAQFTLAITGLFSIPQNVTEFSAEDIFSMDSIEAGQVVMGVDGNLAAGTVRVPVPQSVYLMANSPSNLMFEAWQAVEQASGVKFPAIGVIQLPSVNKIYALTNGFLTKYPPISDAKKSLQPRKYEITWQQVLVSPSFGLHT